MQLCKFVHLTDLNISEKNIACHRYVKRGDSLAMRGGEGKRQTEREKRKREKMPVAPVRAG